MMRHPSKFGRTAFTMVEMLVAVAILALLVVLVAQMVQSGSAVIAGSRKNLNADAQAREVFSRFSMDVAQMVKHPNVDAIFSNQAGASRMFFLSESPGFSSSSGASGTLTLIGYRVGEDVGLERLGKNLPWSGPDAANFLTYTEPTDTTALAQSTIAGKWSTTVGSAPTYSGSDSDYHTLADGVVQLAYCFLKKDGTYSFDRDPTQGFRDVSAIILTVAVLDGDSRTITEGLDGISAALPGPTESDLAARILPAETWQDAIRDPEAFAGAAGIPPSAAARIRIYQRAFPLHTL